jgi:hypothetical protein
VTVPPLPAYVKNWGHDETIRVDGWRRDDIVRLRAGTSPKVVIISSFNERYAPIADLAVANWRAYCVHNNYALRFYAGHYHEDPSRPLTFGDKGKFELYYDVRGQADYVMWLDIDALFANFDVRIESRLHPGARFISTYDDSGPLSGLWIAATDDRTERQLRRVYEYAAMTNNVRWGKVEPNGISDQDAFARLMAVPPFSDLLKFCDEATAFGHTTPETYRDGSWIVTFPGCSLEEKIALMKVWSAKCPTS